MVENSASDLSRFALVSEIRVEFISPKQVSPLSSPHTNKHGIKVDWWYYPSNLKNYNDGEGDNNLSNSPAKLDQKFCKGITIPTQLKIGRIAVGETLDSYFK